MMQEQLEKETYFIHKPERGGRSDGGGSGGAAERTTLFA
jgi:hypothetical protein